MGVASFKGVQMGGGGGVNEQIRRGNERKSLLDKTRKPECDSRLWITNAPPVIHVVLTLSTKQVKTPEPPNPNPTGMLGIL